MTKKRMFIINVVILLALVIGFITISVRFNQKIEVLNNELKGAIININTIQEDAKIEALSSKVDGLSQEIKALPIDKNLVVKGRVEKWLDLILNKQFMDIDGEAVGAIMGVDPTLYPDFFTDESIDRLDFMIDTVFHFTVGFEVKDQFLDDNEYLVQVSDGNAFNIYMYDETFYSMWNHACDCDAYIQSFVEILKKSDFEGFKGYIQFEEYDPDPLEAELEFRAYVDTFNLEEINCRFDGIDLYGFRYEIFDMEGHSKELHVVYDSGFTFIVDLKIIPVNVSVLFSELEKGDSFIDEHTVVDTMNDIKNEGLLNHFIDGEGSNIISIIRKMNNDEALFYVIERDKTGYNCYSYMLNIENQLNHANMTKKHYDSIRRRENKNEGIATTYYELKLDNEYLIIADK